MHIHITNISYHVDITLLYNVNIWGIRTIRMIVIDVDIRPSQNVISPWKQRSRWLDLLCIFLQVLGIIVLFISTINAWPSWHNNILSSSWWQTR